jgi:hypothetical protein
MGALISWLTGPELACPGCGKTFTNPESRYAEVHHQADGHSFLRAGQAGLSATFVGAAAETLASRR